MLRLVGFLVLVFVLSRFLGELPLVGGFFRATGCLGVWLTAIGLSWAITWWGKRAVRVQRDRSRVRELLAVDSAHNRGKLGALLLGQGRPRKALEYLQEAHRREPDVAEWAYRTGTALLALGQHDEAATALRRALELEEECAYGEARLRLVQALVQAKSWTECLAQVEVFDRLHGPRPESAYRRGQALRGQGRKELAREAFRSVAELAREAVRYQRREAGWWSLRARLALLG